MISLKKRKKVDSILLGVTLLLLFFGLVMISSAGVIVSQFRFDDKYFFFKHQLFFGVIPGLLMMFFVSKLSYKIWKKFSVAFFAIAVLFLILIFIPGFGMKLLGASRWIDLGPVSFQPSEMMKLALIIYLAAWLEKKSNKLDSIKEVFLPFVLIMSFIGLLIIAQPDVGTLGAICLISFVMFFVSGAPVRFLFSLLGSGVALLLALIKMEPYRMNRFLVFRNPDMDPQGIGYQIKQALIAVGSGGFFGLGIGQSRQKYNYLPEPLGDSIYAIVGEELGFVGAVFLLVLFLLFALRGLKIARNAPDKFSALLSVGIVSWIVFQAFINIMAIIGLIPLTGIPLPFISYGSTSLVFIMIAVGILLNISRYSKL